MLLHVLRFVLSLIEHKYVVAMDAKGCLHVLEARSGLNTYLIPRLPA